MTTYSKEFIEKIKEVYPDSKEMLELAENGDRFVGRYLDDSRSSYPYKTIYNYFGEDGKVDAETFDKFVKLVKKEHEKVELYSTWWNTEAKHLEQNRKYSDEFIARVKEVYSDNPEIIKSAENNESFLGRWLDDSCTSIYEGIYNQVTDPSKTRDEIIKDMMDKSKIAKDQNDLYSMWWDEINAENEQ